MSTPGAAADPGLLPERIAAALTSILRVPPLAAWNAHVLSIVVFAVAGWRMTPRAGAGVFTLHEKSSWNVVALGFGLLVVVESVPTHLAVWERSHAVAWVLSALAAYCLLWLIGDYQALRLRPCLLQGDAMLVRVGLRWKVRVPLAAIAGVRRVRDDAPSRRERSYLRATVFGDPELLIELDAPVEATGPYGIKRSVQRIGISPDERDAFVTALTAPQT